MKSAGNENSKFPASVQKVLGAVLNHTAYYSAFGGYVLENKDLCLTFNQKEYSDLLSFVQSVSAGDI